MKKTLSIVLLVLLVFLAVACSPEHQHDYKLVPEKSIEAKCESNGYNYMECSCGAIQSIPTAALGHDYVVDEDESYAATCKTKGKDYRVCSRCGDISSKDLPISATNHIFKEGFKGQMNSAEFVTYPTCAKDGLAKFTTCLACEKDGSYEIVIPSSWVVETYGHVIFKEDAKTLDNKYAKITVDDVKEWKTDETETPFVEGLEHAVCPTCGKEMTSQRKETSASAPYSALYRTREKDNEKLLGSWVCYDENKDDSTTYKYYSLELGKENGFWHSDAYLLDVTKGYVTWTDGFDSKVTLTNKCEWKNYSDSGTYAAMGKGLELTNVFYLGKNETYEYIISQVADNTIEAFKSCEKGDFVLCTLLVSATDSVKTPALVCVLEPTNHKHEFTLMNGYGSVTTSGHYVECNCGMKYVKVAHSGICETCGWSEDWDTVTLNSKYIFEIEKDSGLALAGPTVSTAGSGYKYTFFSGETCEYGWINLSAYDSSKSKNGVYYASSGSLTAVLTKN